MFWSWRCRHFRTKRRNKFACSKISSSMSAMLFALIFPRAERASTLVVTLYTMCGWRPVLWSLFCRVIPSTFRVNRVQSRLSPYISFSGNVKCTTFPLNEMYGYSRLLTRFTRNVLGITRQKRDQSTGHHPHIVYYGTCNSFGSPSTFEG